MAGRHTKIFLRLGRVAGARGIVGAFNPDLADVRIEQKSRDGAGRVHGPLKRPVQFAARHIVGGEECHADGVQAGLHRDALALTRPLPVVFEISLSQSNSFTRSPSTVTSSCSPLTPPRTAWK